MRRFTLFVVVVTAVLLSCNRELTPEQQQQLGNLRHELGSLDDAIASAKAEDEKLAGARCQPFFSAGARCRSEVLRSEGASEGASRSSPDLPFFSRPPGNQDPS